MFELMRYITKKHRTRKNKKRVAVFEKKKEKRRFLLGAWGSKNKCWIIFILDYFILSLDRWVLLRISENLLFKIIWIIISLVLIYKQKDSIQVLARKII